MKQILLILFLAICGVAIAQDPGYYEQNVIQQRIDNLFPPSPTASELAKYADIPVNKYTGVPSISIPIYTINVDNNGFTIPISLSYHAAGFKIEDEASWVGLGWSLNAGGVICRTVKGLPDDAFYSVAVVDTETGRYYEQYDLAGYLYGSDWINSMHDDTIYNTFHYKKMHDVAKGAIDGQPDIFYFNFLGYSGEFIFDNYNIPRLLNQLPIEIKYTMNIDDGIHEFEITDEWGNKFFFKDAEHQTIYEIRDYVLYNPYNFSQSENYQNTNLKNYPLNFNSSWYLSKIVTQTGKIVKFSYGEVDHLRINGMTGVIRGTNASKELKFNQSADLIKTKVLDSIVWDNGRIEFISTRTRLDCDPNFSDPFATGPKKLTNIQDTKSLNEIHIKNKQGTIKKYLLDNDGYFLSPNFDNSGTNSWAYRRLKLSGLREVGITSNNTIAQYTFAYNAIQLPHRFSNSQDYWGFYNGIDNGYNIYPKIYIYPNDGASNFEKYQGVYSAMPRPYYSGNQVILQGTNRAPSSEFIKACILEKITLPTGGYQEFAFESNDFNLDNTTVLGGGLRIESIKTHDGFSLKKRLFYYKDADQISSGRIIDMPNFGHFNFYSAIYFPSDSYKTVNDVSWWLTHTGISTRNSCLGSTKGSVVGYKKVTEREIGNGYMESFFELPVYFGILKYGKDKNQNDIYQISKSKFTQHISSSYHQAGWISQIENIDRLPIPANPDYDFNRGQTTKELFYRESETKPFKKIEYKYNEDAEINYRKIRCFDSKISERFIFADDYHYVFKYSCFYNLSAWKYLKLKREVEYFNKDSLVRETSFTYNCDFHKQVSTKKISDPKIPANDLEIHYSYPSDVGIGVYHNLAYLNMLAYPIETTVYRNNNVLSSILNTFRLENGIYVPDQIFSLETTEPLSAFTKFTGNVKDSHYGTTPDHQFQQYDTKGNILQYTSKAGVTTCILWDATGSFVLAKVDGVTYSQISSLAGKASNYSSKTLWSNLREKLETLAPNAVINTYSHKPLVGMTEQTDINGITTYYTYDSFGRLSEVRDDDGNLIKKNSYNYANQ